MRQRKKLLLIAGASAGVLALLLMASAVSGTSPQQMVSNAVSGLRPGTTGTHPPLCCGTEYPCAEGQTTPLPSYCCRCSCYTTSAQGAGTSPQMVPCALEGGTYYCGYCPPVHCTGICPMSPPPTSGP